jgi:hypothetical protein
MPSARESRAALQLVTAAAIDTATGLLAASTGSSEARRLLLLESVPELVGYFSEGSAALAVDFYEEERELAGVRGKSFTTELVINDRTVKIRRGVAWAAEPLFEGAEDVSAHRLAEVIQLETARPYRDTITANRRRDPEAVGWRRISSGKGCAFCKALADRGAIFRQETARFAAHENCHCTAQPVFGPNDSGEEASALQYIASKRRRTPAEKQAVRDWISAYE